ncbi:MAG: hypothetical protein RMI39_08895 [Thermoanaerobaculum sp.]|nr:hypothetical protein [Thermoanaerobaculum sp.]
MSGDPQAFRGVHLGSLSSNQASNWFHYRAVLLPPRTRWVMHGVPPSPAPRQEDRLLAVLVRRKSSVVETALALCRPKLFRWSRVCFPGVYHPRTPLYFSRWQGIGNLRAAGSWSVLLR